MDLPLELRLDIYELVLPKNEILSFGNMGSTLHPPQSSAALTNHLGQYLPLTQVSHQVRDETNPVLYGQNAFEVILRADKVIVGNSRTEPVYKGQSVKKHVICLRELAPVQYLTYGDRHAATWARVVRAETIAQIKRLVVGIEKADAIIEWRHLPHLVFPPSRLSLEGDSPFSAYRWHMHAIEMKCPGLDTWTWNVDSTQYHVKNKRLALIEGKAAEGKRTDNHQACGRCSLMLDEWRKVGIREGGTSREHFLRLVWYGGRESRLRCYLKLTSIQ